MITITINDAELASALDNMIRSANIAPAAFDEIGAGLADNIRLGIRDGETPWGEPFAPLKRARRNSQDTRISDKPLNDTRQHIYNKITHRATGDGVEVGMFENAPIGLTHQFGSKKNNIPARPFMPIDPGGNASLPASWEAEIMATVIRHLDQN